MKVIKEESEGLGLPKINDDLFTYDTPLGTDFDEFNLLSGMDDDLFTYKVKIPGLFIFHVPCNSYKKQFEEYMEIKRQWEVYGLYTNVLRDLYNTEFSVWLASKFCNHMTIDWYTKNAL
ncbi:hypothetical protein Tco_1081104 [Tanacetum coccineum]|uniref:Uncharacterized protein n=1 Tax=Tanacetum coccineum TaxID=301880 RepID=A0ABQ5HWS9_9ASTR